MKTGLFYDPVFLSHDTGGHPENSGRLSAIMEALRTGGLLERLQAKTPRQAVMEELAPIHDPGYVRRVEEAALSGRPYLDTPDCVISEETYRVALHAAGAMIDAVTQVASGSLDNAFLACRPPGHHAEHDRAMGFCYFNNIALGAQWLTTRLGYERILIFDFDVHHGNGTQHSFEERKDVFFCSIHQNPMTLFPGTGFPEERGRGEGRGYTVNVAMNPHSGDDDYEMVFRQQLLPMFREYKPEFVLISAGFDGHQDDPLASMNLTVKGYDAMIREMKRLAGECCAGKLVSTLEGGYNYRSLSECVSSHLEILQDDAF
ncbi:MAG: histone deacetylase [Deltaproteobacteria bacterium]|nr:histone deacetylase [Deltaproteobacteria bacterium]